jgi:hypothetical protein
VFIPVAAARERYAICKSCEEFNNTIKTCKKCGCFMPAKVAVSYVQCPIGKWRQHVGEPSITTEYRVED